MVGILVLTLLTLILHRPHDFMSRDLADCR
jgi:hypothetical protein